MSESEQTPWQHVYDEMGISLPILEDRPLGQYLEDHAKAIPNAPALQYYAVAISYSQLNEEANKLANVLISLGVEPGDVVGFHMPNIPQYAIAVAAISKIGCAGSGVSPLMTATELTHQLQDANIKVLISLDSLITSTIANLGENAGPLKQVISVSAADYLTPSEQPLTDLGTIQNHHYRTLMAGADSQFSQREVSGDTVMMVQYTGGTTGRPKGAELTLRGTMNNAIQYAEYLPWKVGAESVHTGFPMFHVAGLAFAIASLRFGAQLVLIPDPRDLALICQQMKKYPPTRIAAVPSLFQMLVNHPPFHEVDFSRLEIANTGAAPMSAEDREKLEAVIGEGKLSDVFGMTETGPVHVCNPPGRCKPTSIGIPVPHAETRIVDLETGQNEMPIGEAGEIITCGPQVMKGYLNLPEESAKAMRQWRGKTWMYTGDVGYTDEEGYIYLCDRAKDMLIVGGYKVFSIEVEDKLQALPQIALTAVIGEPDEKRAGNDVVHLYVELTSDAKKQGDLEEIESEIFAFCKEKMAPYKVPKKIHFIDAIPLTPVGKIDKKALRGN